MKLDIDLPWGGKRHFERPALSEDARYTRSLALGAIGIGLFFLAFIYLLR